MKTAGIHHITAFARDPQQNVDFYAGVLGLRLVKKTINFDAPEVYHLYFGNEAGSPGTIITFFPWPNSRRGRIGGGQVGITSYAVPAGSLAFWEERLARFGIQTEKVTRFSETSLQFSDNEGLRLEIVERVEGANSRWSFGGIPGQHAIKGFAGAVLFSTNPARTKDALEQLLGFVKEAEDAGYTRFRSEAGIGNVIDVPHAAMERGSDGAGTVHHIAWRAEDFEHHEAWRTAVQAYGYQPTPVVDRQYFNALYFREAGGILFEIATDPPGFAKDEAPEALGEKVMLPEWYEPHRAQIEANLLPIEVRVLEGDQS
ncbi:ring-cleaving dioxygenase [Paenibacillus mucilaginosus]|uniref:MhqO n=2 Tax=Paenibacillus mucilaginosus TaxID=61624 RepID=H6NS82_9BACL|nr:ring-cleaving dioxygenase [Paenibacillus mucilaginosus]AEI39083.1 MhqO [Paenibacillus mucilaginosus KNP414]AFC27376.1 MhqO [Paenibacillus mucilaginosus 3016]MCG7216210.1 ring-cleaving dioxygenase [Paenibacillus mucilaginosus]WDM28110.1 ring-cleaving dioxygenase [Paenibacillus mucilaginosus]WFA16286.1 ring-cleaving dioxygenase [Paenibacillus mucilaginosus]